MSKVVKKNYNKEPGTIVDVEKDGFIVQTGNNSVMILELKPDGKKKMTTKEFLNGIKKEDLLNKKFEKE